MSDPWSSAPSCVSSLVQLCAQNCDHLPPPPNPYISETAFSHRFQKAYTYPPPPPTERNFGALDQNLKNPRKIANWLCVGINRMSPRDMRIRQEQEQQLSSFQKPFAVLLALLKVGPISSLAFGIALHASFWVLQCMMQFIAPILCFVHTLCCSTNTLERGRLKSCGVVWCGVVWCGAACCVEVPCVWLLCKYCHAFVLYCVTWSTIRGHVVGVLVCSTCNNKSQMHP